jgi:RNA polymerase sigma-70 factor, ECF subfamily
VRHAPQLIQSSWQFCYLLHKPPALVRLLDRWHRWPVVTGGARNGKAGVAEVDLSDIYARHRQGMFTHALSITGDAGSAEDAVHDAFARLCRTVMTGLADPVAYAFAAVRRAAIDQRRRSLRLDLARNDAGAALSIFVALPEASAIQAERAQSVAHALACLSVAQREIVILRAYAELSFVQIAEVTGEPLPTIASRYRRSLEELRGRLEKLV